MWFPGTAVGGAPSLQGMSSASRLAELAVKQALDVIFAFYLFFITVKNPLRISFS